jgi:hypothetical protein
MKKSYFFVAVFLIVSSVFYAQIVVPDATSRQIDDIIARNAAPELKTALAKNAKAAWYPNLEAYILKQARQMVADNKLDSAKMLAQAVVDQNRNNKDAVSLYGTIKDAITKRDAAAKQAADEQVLAVLMGKSNISKTQTEIPKSYKTATNPVSGKTVYLDQDFNNHYSKFNWDFLLGLANINDVYSSGTNSLKYGLSIGGSFFYLGENTTVGGEVDGSAMMMTLTGGQTINWTGSAIGSLSANKLNKYVVLRLGYLALGDDYGTAKLESELFMTPVTGLGLRDIKFGKTGRIKTALDYYPGHLMVKDMPLALGAQIFSTFVLADMHDFDIQLQTGIKDSFRIYDDGFKNDAKIVFAVGVGNYE